VLQPAGLGQPVGIQAAPPVPVLPPGGPDQDGHPVVTSVWLGLAVAPQDQLAAESAQTAPIDLLHAIGLGGGELRMPVLVTNSK